MAFVTYSTCDADSKSGIKKMVESKNETSPLNIGRWLFFTLKFVFLFHFVSHISDADSAPHIS